MSGQNLNTVLVVVTVLIPKSIIALFAGGIGNSNQLSVEIFFLKAHHMILVLAFF